MRWIGHRLHAEAELDISPDTTLAEAHRIAHEAEHTLTHAVPRLSTALVHAYPAGQIQPRRLNMTNSTTEASKLTSALVTNPENSPKPG